MEVIILKERVYSVKDFWIKFHSGKVQIYDAIKGEKKKSWKWNWKAENPIERGKVLWKIKTLMH